MKIVKYNDSNKSYVFNNGYVAFVHDENLLVFKDKIKLKNTDKGYKNVVNHVIQFMLKGQK